jgi:predicted kinase
VDFIGLWLDAPLAELEARVAGRARDASDATVEVLRAAAPANPGPGDWMAVDTTDAATAWNLVTQAVRSHLVPCWNCSPALRE